MRERVVQKAHVAYNCTPQQIRQKQEQKIKRTETKNTNHNNNKTNINKYSEQ